MLLFQKHVSTKAGAPACTKYDDFLIIEAVTILKRFHLGIHFFRVLEREGQRDLKQIIIQVPVWTAEM